MLHYIGISLGVFLFSIPPHTVRNLVKFSFKNKLINFFGFFVSVRGCKSLTVHLVLYEGKYKDCSHNFDSKQGSKFYDSAHIFDSVRFSKSETCDMFCQCMKENTMTVHIILQCTRKQTQRQCTYFWQCRRSKSLTVHIALSVYEREYNDWFYCMYIFKQCTRLQGYDNAHIFLIVNKGARLWQCTYLRQCNEGARLGQCT